MIDGEALDDHDRLYFTMILTALDGGAPDVTGAGLIEAVVKQEATLWAVIDVDTDSVLGAVVSSFVEYDSGYKAMVVYGAASLGRRLKISEFRSIGYQLEMAAKVAGCDGIRFVGHRGWGRVLEGYHETGIVYDKRVAEVN